MLPRQLTCFDEWTILVPGLRLLHDAIVRQPGRRNELRILHMRIDYEVLSRGVDLAADGQLAHREVYTGSCER